jgi:Uma2 family endonuclease
MSYHYWAMSTAALRLVSEEEFLSLPESTDRIELLDGEVILLPSPSYRHQRALLALVRGLSAWAEQQKDVTVVMAPMDVRFQPGRILQPDAFVVFQTLDPNSEAPLNLIPELCVEVLSANRSYDRMTKRLVYAEAGVQELWTVDPDTGRVERWHGDRLSECEVHDGTLASPLLPGFAFELEQLR